MYSNKSVLSNINIKSFLNKFFSDEEFQKGSIIFPLKYTYADPLYFDENITELIDKDEFSFIDVNFEGDEFNDELKMKRNNITLVRRNFNKTRTVSLLFQCVKDSLYLKSIEDKLTTIIWFFAISSNVLIQLL